MASLRCSTCSINYPAVRTRFSKCAGCGEKTSWFSDVQPDEDWDLRSAEVRSVLEDGEPPLPSREDKVERWRYEVLVRAGYTRGAASDLAARRDVDLHQAADMRRAGCAEGLALEILT